MLWEWLYVYILINWYIATPFVNAGIYFSNATVQFYPAYFYWIIYTI